MEYVVDGNTVLSVAEVEEAVYPFLGEARDAADVDKARDALEHVYRLHGFQTVQVGIPRQGVENGIIHLQVIENPVGRLRVVDSKYHSLDEIKGNAPSLAEGKVLNLNDVQKDIVALNQQPDMKVTPRLKPGQESGTVDVDLQVEDKLPIHASLEINNQNNQATTPLRLIATASYDNLWQLGHSFAFTYEVAPQNPNDATVYSASYLLKVPETQLSLLFYGVKSDSDVAALAGTDVIGRGNIVGARGVIDLPGDDAFSHSLTFGFDRKDLLQNVVTNGTPTQAPILYYPVSITYAPLWREPDSTTQASLSVNFALPGTGSTSTEFDAQRFDAVREYFYAKAGVSETLQLPWDTVFETHIQGQIADGALLSSEQLSAGGANSVRGYLEAERLGDDGVIANAEFRSPSIGSWISPTITDWHFLAFADGAALRLHDPLPDERTAFQLASVGAGTRFGLFDAVNGSLDVAFPLIDGAVTKVGKLRLHFRVWARM